MLLLVVERDEDVREVLVEALRVEGYRARGVRDDAAALQSCTVERPALMVVNLLGPEVERLAQESRCKMLLVSTRATALRATAERLGLPLISAPFAFETLLDAVVRELAAPYGRGAAREETESTRATTRRIRDRLEP